MKMYAKPRIGIMLGDQAGIGPEIAVKALSERQGLFAPVIIGNKDLFTRAVALYGSTITLQSCAFVDTPSSHDLPVGQVSVASGLLMHEGLMKSTDLLKTGKIDALIMSPITKQSLNAAALHFSSEFQFFEDSFQKSHVKAVVMASGIFRCAVTGHCAFRDIIKNLTMSGIVDSGLQLLQVMSSFGKSADGIAVAALNPHAGENGLFGDEEDRLIKPAIMRLRKSGANVIGPCPADTVLQRAINKEVGGIVYLYHDQGNIAFKSRFFGEGVLIYTQVPGIIVSVGHGSALDIAGKGIADHQNMLFCIDTVMNILSNRSKMND
jgi:4-hydroxythreonine-4-phosphate dehydrogenase